jgi:hypothetical protein
MLAAAQIQACLLPVFRPEGGPDPLHDLLVEVERGRLVSVQVRTLTLRTEQATCEGKVLGSDGLFSDVFVFVALEFGVCFVVPRQEVSAGHRVMWQPPALRKRKRRRDAFDLDPYLMAFDKLWVGSANGPRLDRRRPLIDEMKRRSRLLIFGEPGPDELLDAA